MYQAQNLNLLDGTDVFFALVFCAIILEGITTYVQTIVVERKIAWQVVMTICAGVITAIAFNVDLFRIIGISSVIPFFGSFLTGILMSRGSNYIFDIISKLNIGMTRPETTKKDE